MEVWNEHSNVFIFIIHTRQRDIHTRFVCISVSNPFCRRLYTYQPKKVVLEFSKGVKREMWSHDEQKEINDSYVVMARITCKYCGAVVHKYVESHYTGGSKCVILAKYCRFCGNALRI